MIKKNNKLFCIIGVGDHSNLKLLPALLKSGKKIVGLVSRSQTSNIRKFKRFNNIDLALKKLPKETVFLISTPPLSHFYYINIFALVNDLEKKRKGRWMNVRVKCVHVRYCARCKRRGLKRRKHAL